MVTQKQRVAAKKNVKKAQAGAKRKRTLAHLPAKTRTALGKEANKVRKGEAETRKDLEQKARRDVVCAGDDDLAIGDRLTCVCVCCHDVPPCA